MGSFIPKWPLAAEDLPAFVNAISPVTSQWFNNLQTLCEILEAEIGLDLTAYPTRTARQTLDILTYNDGRAQGSAQDGKMRGLNVTRTTMTRGLIGAGNTILGFSLIAPEDTTDGGPESSMFLGTIETASTDGGYVNGHPIIFGNDNIPSNGRTPFYVVKGGFSDTGVLTGAGTVEVHALSIGMAEFQ